MAVSSDDVVIKVSAESDAARAALESIATSFEKISDKASHAGKESSGMLENAIGQATQFASSMVGIGSVMATLGTAAAALKSEYEQLVQRQKAAADVQLPFADAQRRFGLLLRPNDDIDTATATSRIMKSSGETGGGASGMAIAYEHALSTKGSFGASDALDAVIAGKRLRPDLKDGDGLGKLSEAIMIQRKRFGGTSDEAASSVFAGYATARNTDIDSYAQYTLPAIASAFDFGNGKDSWKFLASRVMGVQQTAEDPSGRKTRTGMVQLLKQLREKTAGAGLSNDSSIEEMEGFLFSSPQGEQIRKQLLGPLWKGSGTEDEIGEFGKNMHLEGGSSTFMAMVQYLRNDQGSPLWKNINENMRQLPGSNAEAKRAVAKSVASIEAQPVQVNAKLARMNAGFSESFDEADDVGAAASIGGDIISDAAKRAGGWAYTKSFEFDYWMKRDKLKSKAAVATEVERSLRLMEPSSVGVDSSGSKVYDSAKERDLAEYLKTMIEHLEAISGKLNKQELKVTGGGESVPARLDAVGGQHAGGR